jgi:hypothetical protein
MGVVCSFLLSLFPLEDSADVRLGGVQNIGKKKEKDKDKVEEGSSKDGKEKKEKKTLGIRGIRGFDF